MKNTEKNREKLAKEIIDLWDMDTLIDYAHNQLSSFYKKNYKAFIEDYNYMFNEK